ncbi:CHAT domain-containing protein [Actinoplanes sp. NPDC051851]|uniref:CHAT domain-containing protein n=1 Tax=Actinoplanes sp. NPDC051851 TaxID=3154753 RepID=UPI0034352DE9
MVRLAAEYGDFAGAVEYLLGRHPLIDTRDLDNDNDRRTKARQFVSMCIRLLEREDFAGHPREAELDAAMRDVARRAADVLNDPHHRGFQRIRETRDRRRFRDTIRRTRAERVEGLPPTGDPGADAAIERAELHDDFGPLDALIARDGSALLRARRHILRGSLTAAVDALTERTPAALATRGLLIARDDLDRGIALCRAGRRAGLTWWRRTTPADGPLARLLLMRALGSGDGLSEAVRLVRRVDDPVLRQEVLAARDALTGRGTPERRQEAWRRAAHAPGSPAALARLALAWAEWAAGTGVAEYAAEAYERLVTLAAQDATARQDAGARDRVLLAAQEYAEEAGYWLARCGRFREAVLALETGRAVALSSGADGSPGTITYPDVTAQTGDGAIVYLAAARAGGYALVVAATHDPQYVDLPDLDRATIAGLTTRAPAAVPPGPARDLTPAGPAPTGPMDETLRLLWDGGLRNLVWLSARGRVVTLIPIGLLNLLPLHAVGEHGPGDHHIGEFSAIRYAPNVRSLARSRAAAVRLRTADQTLLAVDAPGDPHHRLRHVARETAEVTARWPGRAATAVHDCTWAEFRATADRHTVWHLACHGDAEPDDIQASRLHFADRAVTLAELAATLRPDRRRLAVLSACHTNTVGSALPNEVVGLPSALLQIGFAGVIATGWAVDDLATMYAMTAFYHFWGTSDDEPALALHRARHWLRHATRADLTALVPGVLPPPSDNPYADPRFWAAFAYTGA